LRVKGVIKITEKIKIETTIVPKSMSFCNHTYNGDKCENMTFPVGNLIRFPKFGNQRPHYTCQKHAFLSWGKISWWQIENNMEYLGNDEYAPCEEGYEIIYNYDTRRKEKVKING
jgi:hypothetical protein